MANITLRQSSVVADPSATIKNSPLTNAEVDNNFANINISSGVLTSLNTISKSNLVIAINELSSNIFGISTGNVSETVGSLYYTNVRAFANLLNATTTSLSEGTNQYFTNTRAIDTVEDTGLNMTGNVTTPGLTISGSGNIAVGGGITTVGINSSAHVLGTNVYAAGGLTATGDLLISGTSRFGGALLTNSFFSEEANIISTGFANTSNIYNLRDDGVVHYHTGDATANANVNIYGVDQTMEVGNVVSMAVLITQGASPKYVSGVMVGNVQANVVRWQGGTVPTVGTAASNIDVYVFNIIKTGAVAYTVLSSQTQFGGTQG